MVQRQLIRREIINEPKDLTSRRYDIQRMVSTKNTICKIEDFEETLIPGVFEIYSA